MRDSEYVDLSCGLSLLLTVLKRRALTLVSCGGRLISDILTEHYDAH